MKDLLRAYRRSAGGKSVPGSNPPPVSEARRQERQRVERQIENLIDAIAGGMKSSSLQRKLETLEARKAELEGDAEDTPRPNLHPNLALNLW